MIINSSVKKKEKESPMKNEDLKLHNIYSPKKNKQNGSFFKIENLVKDNIKMKKFALSPYNPPRKLGTGLAL